MARPFVAEGRRAKVVGYVKELGKVKKSWARVDKWWPVRTPRVGIVVVDVYSTTSNIAEGGPGVVWLRLVVPRAEHLDDALAIIFMGG